jgi:hypothetical protein
MSRRVAALGTALLLVMCGVGCSKPAAPRTVDELRAAVEAYQQQKPGVTEERVDALFARLDADIAALRADAAARPADQRGEVLQQASTLSEQRAELQKIYVAARVARFGATAGDMLRGLGEQIGKGLEDAGRRLRDSMQDGQAAPPSGQ